MADLSSLSRSDLFLKDLNKKKEKFSFLFPKEEEIHLERSIKDFQNNITSTKSISIITDEENQKLNSFFEKQSKNQEKPEKMRKKNHLDYKTHTNGGVGRFKEVFESIEKDLNNFQGICKKEVPEEDDDDFLELKLRKKKRVKPVKTLIRETLDKSLQILDENPKKLKSLKRKIQKRTKFFSSGSPRVKNKRIIQRNIENIKHIENRGITIQNEHFSEQKKRYNELNKIRRKKLDQDKCFMRRKKQQEYEKRLSQAIYHKKTLMSTLNLIERTQKWSFLVSFFSRISIVYNGLAKKKQSQYEAARRKELTNIVYKRMIPIIRAKRREKWNKAWNLFKKFWYFYRIWVHVKRRKEATAIIKAFLKSAGFEIKFVKRVHQFGMYIKNCQYYIRKAKKVWNARLMVNLFQYTIVESKMVLERKLDDKRVGFVVKSFEKNSPYRPAKPLKTRSGRSTPKTAGISRVKTDFGIISGDTNFYDNFVKPGSSGPFCLLLPAFEVRVKIISNYLKKKKKEYEREMPIYLTKLKSYKDKLQQQKFIEKAKRLLKERKNDSNNDREELEVLFDEKGRIIKKPLKPFLHIFISESEMEILVKKGLKIVREKEAKLFSATKSKILKAKLTMEHEKTKNEMKKLHEILKMEFGEKYEARKKLFPAAAKRVREIRKQREYFHTCNTRYSNS